MVDLFLKWLKRLKKVSVKLLFLMYIITSGCLDIANRKHLYQLFNICDLVLGVKREIIKLTLKDKEDDKETVTDKG